VSRHTTKLIITIDNHSYLCRIKEELFSFGVGVRKTAVCFLFCLCLPFPAAVQAEEATAAGRAFNLDALVVTASRTARPLADTPVRTQILDQAVIQRLHSRDLRDALRLMPGVQLREIHGKTGDEVYLQGFNGDRVLILVDGLPVSATTGSAVDTSQLATLDIEHIEIITGASSALYGSAAMGGVINIITRQPESGRHARLAADAGSYGDRQLNSDGMAAGETHLMASGGVDWLGWDWSAGADRRHSGGYDLNKSTYPSDGHRGDKTNLSLGASRRWQQGDIRLQAERYIEDVDTRRLTNAGAEGSKPEVLSRDRFSLQNSLYSGYGNWSLAYLYEQQHDSSDQLNTDDSVRAGNLWRDTDYHQQKASLQWHDGFYTPGSGVTEITSGLEWFQESMEQTKDEITLTDEGVADDATVTELDDGSFYIATTEVPYEQRHSLEWFTQAIIPLGQSFELSPGFRWQDDSDFGGYFAPVINSRLSWNTGNFHLQWRNSVAAGYRVPNLKERYYIFDHSINGYKVLGNSDLDPEKSRSLQTSLSITDGHGIHLEISLFNNRVRDLIEAAATGDSEQGGTVDIYQYTNYANTLMRGYEIALQQQLTQSVSQRLSYSYLDARDLDNDTALINRARHHLKGLWLWDAGSRWQLTLSGEYQGGYLTSAEESGSSTDSGETAGFQRWDIKASYALSAATSLYGGMENMFDIVRDPADSNDRRPVYGRYVYAGFLYQF